MFLSRVTARLAKGHPALTLSRFIVPHMPPNRTPTPLDFSRRFSSWKACVEARRNVKDIPGDE